MIETNCFEETIYWLKVLLESLLKPSKRFVCIFFDYLLNGPSSVFGYGDVQPMLVNIWLLANVFFIKLGSKQGQQNKNTIPKKKHFVVSQWSFFAMVSSRYANPSISKINVTFKITKKMCTRKSNQKGFVYILIFSFKCNLVLFADIGYRLYVQPSITIQPNEFGMKKTSKSFFTPSESFILYLFFDPLKNEKFSYVLCINRTNDDFS